MYDVKSMYVPVYRNLYMTIKWLFAFQANGRADENVRSSLYGWLYASAHLDGVPEHWWCVPNDVGRVSEISAWNLFGKLVLLHR